MQVGEAPEIKLKHQIKTRPSGHPVPSKVRAPILECLPGTKMVLAAAQGIHTKRSSVCCLSYVLPAQGVHPADSRYLFAE